MSTMASQITSITIVYPTVYSRCRSKTISKLRVTGLCEGNSPVSCEFSAERASNVENVSIWWRHHDSFYASIKSLHTADFWCNHYCRKKSPPCSQAGLSEKCNNDSICLYCCLCAPKVVSVVKNCLTCRKLFHVSKVFHASNIVMRQKIVSHVKIVTERITFCQRVYRMANKIGGFEFSGRFWSMILTHKRVS